jgi:Icc protein
MTVETIGAVGVGVAVSAGVGVDVRAGIGVAVNGASVAVAVTVGSEASVGMATTAGAGLHAASKTKRTIIQKFATLFMVTDYTRAFTSSALQAKDVRVMTQAGAPSSRPLLRFVHISDTHLSGDPSYNLQETSYAPIFGGQALVDQLNSLPFTPDFILHTGDVAYDPDPAAYSTAREVLGQIKYPVYYLAGNHDDPVALQRIFLRSETILKPFEYELEINGVQIITVDSNGPAEQPAGAVTQAQLDRLSALCAVKDDRPLIVATHHNVLPMGAPFWDTFMRMKNGEDFHKALLPAKDRIRGVFHGHVHEPVDMYRDGILYATAESSWYQLETWPDQADISGDRHMRPGFSVVLVTENQTFIRRHQFRVRA